MEMMLEIAMMVIQKWGWMGGGGDDPKGRWCQDEDYGVDDDSDGDSLVFFVLFCLFETGSFSHTDCRLPRNLLYSPSWY